MLWFQAYCLPDAEIKRFAQSWENKAVCSNRMLNIVVDNENGFNCSMENRIKGVGRMIFNSNGFSLLTAKKL